MNLLNFFGYVKQGSQVASQIKEQPNSIFFKETSRADSSLYEPYILRPYNPDDLYQKKGDYSLFDEMREDDQINALLTLKKLMILGDWEISCDNADVKEFLEWNLLEAIDEMFDRKLFNILSAMDYGFSVTEKIFSYEETKKWGKKYILKSLKTRAPHTFEFPQDDKGNITDIFQDTSNGKDIRLNPQKFIHYIYQKEFDNPYGKSEMNKGVYRAWYSKNAIIKFWNIYLERFGMPTVVGTYPKTATKDKSDFQKVLKNIQAKTSITKPEDFIVELLESAQKGEGEFESAIDKYNTMIARKMLVPDLMGFSGAKTGGGSYSLGQEQFGIFYVVTNQEKGYVSRIINREIINPLVEWNFGVGIEAAFKFVRVNEEKKASQQKAFIDATKTGKVPTTTEQWNHYLQSIEYPNLEENAIENKVLEDEKKKDEENKRKEDMLKTKLQQPVNGINPQVQPKINPKEIDKKEEKKKLTKEYANYYRELTVYEKDVNFAKIDSELTDINDEYYQILGKLYNLTVNALVDDIKRQKIITRKRLDKINKLELKHQDKIQKVITKMMVDGAKIGKESASVELQKNLTKEYLIEEGTALNNNEAAEWLKEFAFYVTNNEAETILRLSKPILMEAIRNGSGTRDTMRMVDDALKGYDLTVDANRIETMVRTTTAKAFNESRVQEFNKVKDKIPAYQYSAILDGRTSAICTSLDKKIFKQSEMQYYNPPIHFNCRSLLVPVYEDEEFDISTDIPPTTQVAGDFLKLDKEK